MFMIGTSKSYFEKIPEVVSETFTGRNTFYVDMREYSSHDQVKDVLAKGLRRDGEYSRTVFVFDHMEKIDDRDVAKLNALLRPMNREHALMSYGSETIDFAGSLFFFMYRLTDNQFHVLGSHPNKEDLNLFVGSQYSFDRNLFTPEAFVGRISNVLFFRDFGVEGRYPCSDFLNGASNEEGSSSFFLIAVVIILGLIAFVATTRAKSSDRGSFFHQSTSTALSSQRQQQQQQHSQQYDEDDSKGYPLRRSNRTRTSPARHGY